MTTPTAPRERESAPAPRYSNEKIQESYDATLRLLENPPKPARGRLVDLLTKLFLS